MTKKLFIKTHGCQMNEYDSAKMFDLLEEKESFELAETEDEADLLILNTCSIREKAQEKVFHQIGRWRKIKEKNPNLKIAIGGCVASQEGENIIKRAPAVDIVFGPQTLHKLPDLYNEKSKTDINQIDISFPKLEKFNHLPVHGTGEPSAFVSIIEGCNKYCSFCVVPKTRGHEVSRTIEDILNEIESLKDCGINTVALFPNINTEVKDPLSKEALNENNFMCQLVERIKKEFPDTMLVLDVALDPYNSNGHDGIVIDGKIDNDVTLDALKKMSINLANAGADILAPSDMMDGRIGVIREELEKHNHKDTILLSYAAKYSSNFYGPFRDAVGSAQSEGINKDTYQMDYRNINESFKEIQLDINEGADIVMVKPALAYLDIISKLKSKFDVPIFAYQVSGEYAMLKMGIDKNYFGNNVVPETLISLFRAGSSSVLTYFAKWVAENYDNISN